MNGLRFCFCPGPFRDCIGVEDPSNFYESCVYDGCIVGPGSDAICDAYEQYEQSCDHYHKIVEDWRTDLSQCRE